MGSVNIKKEEIKTNGIRFSIEDKKEIAHAYLYIIKNDLHERPYGLIEDVFVDESFRGKGYATELLKELIEEAKKLGCYKLIATSRRSRQYVHKLYRKLGFEDYGIEFRMNF